jgi:hypothetical protein
VLEIVVAEPGKMSTINRSLYQQNSPFVNKVLWLVAKNFLSCVSIGKS